MSDKATIGGAFRSGIDVVYHLGVGGVGEVEEAEGLVML